MMNNNILELKGKFEQESNNSFIGSAELPKGKTLFLSHVTSLKNDLINLNTFWQDKNYISGALIAVHYNDIVAKSRRLKILLTKQSGENPNNTIVGAKFSKDGKKHIITHYINKNYINYSIDKLTTLESILTNEFDGKINSETLKKVTSNKLILKNKNISKSNFAKLVSDCYNVESFEEPVLDSNDINEKAVVSLYETDDLKEVLSNLGIDIYFDRLLDNNILLDENELNLIKEKAPYLISMVSTDFSEVEPISTSSMTDDFGMSIPKPTNEPTIGVIDTLFYKDVYFRDWVESFSLVDEALITDKAFEHGTKVTSIIVDGPSLNKDLDDGCGRFKVRHFGVSGGGSISSFSLMKKIKEIVYKNKDIHVWNLSLGSFKEINPNFISVEGAVLDKLIKETNVIFVIAGTNISIEKTEKIGAPADSINSIVVNATDEFGNPASYSRKGPVLSFFNKPDVSCFGGDNNKPMIVEGPVGRYPEMGTSFAAPWIARKLCYLIDVLGISIECAKALIIDSAAGWNKNTTLEEKKLIGFGVVPQRIEDIITSPKDEIKILIDGVSEKYNTYNYDLPVPISKEKFPYVAKAVLCYFPPCNRSSGVDYTNVELDLQFGRLDDKGLIDTINENNQTKSGDYTSEEVARNKFRKWDNVKRIVQTPTDKRRDKPILNEKRKTWGISIKTKERLNNGDGKGLKFGLVITLKEINEVNRIDTFVRNCISYGWDVNAISVDNKLDIYNIAEEEIEFE